MESTAGPCLSARFPRASATQVTQSFAAPGLARLWAMRSTLHLVPTSDVHRYAAALGDSVAAAQSRLWPRYGVPADAEQAVNAALVEVLADGPLPRAALAARVGARPATPSGARHQQQLAMLYCMPVVPPTPRRER